MSRVSVDHKKALALLEDLARRASEQGFIESDAAGPVRSIIGGSHLTYRYALITALLAKAVNPNVNALALQAGAKIKGAYDARSLCHSVIVPNERRLLVDGLGGSNEPYLNKPVRFGMLSMNNAVRNGNDRRTLKLLIETLRGVADAQSAQVLLADAVHFARTIGESRRTEFQEVVASVAGGRAQVVNFLRQLLSKSLVGETAALVGAAVLWAMESEKGYQPEVRIHPVNEAGTSSNQVSDIDVYDSMRLRLTAEVKDKSFSVHDVLHAADRVKATGHSTLYFLKGPRGILADANEETVIKQCVRHGVEVIFLSLDHTIPVAVAFADADLTIERIGTLINDFAEKARMKQATMQYLLSTLNAFADGGAVL